MSKSLEPGRNNFRRLGLDSVDPANVSEVVIYSVSEGKAIIAGEPRDLHPAFASEQALRRFLVELAGEQEF